MKITLQILALILASLTGFAQWSTDPSINTQVCDFESHQYAQVLISDNAGGAIVLWKDVRNQTPQLYAQHIDDQGNKKWDEDGVPIFAEPTIDANSIWGVKLLHDGEGGYLVIWADERNMNQAVGYSADIYAQKINADGVIQWETAGRIICDADGLQSNYNVIEDGHGGAFIVWEDHRSAKPGIYAQHIDNNGASQWELNGQLIIKDHIESNTLPVLVNDENGGILIFWQQMLNMDEICYKVQRLSASGIPQLQEGGLKAVTLANNDFYLAPEIASDGAGGAILSWYESGIDKKHKILAQRINSSGLPVWPGNTISIYDGPKNRAIPRMISDNNGGAIVIWEHISVDQNETLWGQHINSSGQRLWPTPGLPLMKSAEGFNRYQLTTDGNDGAIIASAIDLGGDILAQKVTGSGMVLWNAKGSVISNAASSQQIATMISNGDGEALIFWQDFRSGNSRIYGTITNNDFFLPVTLIVFDALIQENQTHLSWSTSEEVNNKGFDIERSADGKVFTHIGHVAAMDQAVTLKNYQYTDRTPLAGPNYYRLKQLDHDGKFAYSKMVHVNLPGTSHISVYPNPATGDLFIETEHVSGRIQITDILGRNVLDMRVVKPRTHINVKDLSPGMYIIKGGSFSQVFVKQ